MLVVTVVVFMILVELLHFDAVSSVTSISRDVSTVGTSNSLASDRGEVVACSF
jgi:hypothetical protein